jgi:hypothetical protein
MKQSTYKWEIFDDILIGFATPGRIPPEVWDAFIHDLKTKPITKHLSASFGTVELNSLRRKQISDVFNSRRMIVAIVTDESLVRGLITAVGWFGVNVKGFAWAELRDAIRHVGVQGERVDDAVDLLMKIKKSCFDAERLPMKKIG